MAMISVGVIRYKSGMSSPSYGLVSVQEPQKVMNKLHCIMIQEVSLYGLTTTVRNLDAIFEIPSGIHDTPLIFPLFGSVIELLLPWLVKSFEPIVPIVSIPFQLTKKRREKLTR